MRGIVLAGGSGSRLWPVTLSVSKQLLPVYGKPMIYYPLSALLLAGIKDILIISTPRDIPRFQQLLGGGQKWGVNLSYAAQRKPGRPVQAFIIGAEFISGNNCALALGDNIFYGRHLSESLQSAASLKKGAQIFACKVNEPQRYGVVAFDDHGHVYNLEEKPDNPKSEFAVTGLCFYDSTVIERARSLKPSNRSELEITDLNRTYLEDGRLFVKVLNRGTTWLDTGTYDSLSDAEKFIENIEKQQGMKICCPEEICWRMGHIDSEQLERLAMAFNHNEYGSYLMGLLDE